MLFILGGNPAYNTPSGLNFNQLIVNATDVVHINDYENETSSLSTWILPKSHFLESWGDANPYTGVYTVQQPAINPIFETRQSEANLLSWMNINQNFYNYLKSAHKNQSTKKSWNETLHFCVCLDFQGESIKKKLNV